MATVARKFRIVLVVLSIYLAAVELQFACMNIEFAPVFRTFNVPDRPVTSYVEGNLGIVEPRYFHTYLFWAYRHLSGVGSSRQGGEDRLTGIDGQTPLRSTGIRNPVEAWEAARRAVNPTASTQYWDRYAPISAFSGTGSESWDSFENCPEDAWRTAVATLESRVKQFGEGSTEVREWLSGQEIVFLNCQGDAEVPGSVPPGLHPLIRKDREYQVAAARFYAGAYEEAARRFEAIGRDGDSPWRQWGPYLAARCFIRRGILSGEPNQPERPNLAEARRRLRGVIAAADLSAVHGPARRLLDYVLLRLDPETTMSSLSARLLKPQRDPNLNQYLTDFDWLLDRGVKPRDGGELTDWIITFRDESPEALARALRRWRESKSLPWLISALAKVEPSHSAALEVAQAAAAVESSSPAFVMASYHRFRLLAGIGREDEARKGLDEILWENEVTMPPSARNHMLALRQKLATDFDTFLWAAPRQWVGEFWGEDPTMPQLLDSDSLVALNERLPLRLLQEAARSPRLSQAIRKEITLAAWARAALIEDPVEPELRPLVREHWPELAAEVDEFGALSDRSAQRFALAWLILRHPGIRPYVGASTKREDPIGEIDALRENWWCSFDAMAPMHTANYLKRIGAGSEFYGINPPRPKNQPGDLSFLSDAEKSAAEAELARLEKIPAAPSYLGDVAVNFARAHPDDPRVPEALHLAVRSTRLGCTDDQNTKHSKAAFQLLHRNYPRSDWAAKTKYWY